MKVEEKTTSKKATTKKATTKKRGIKSSLAEQLEEAKKMLPKSQMSKAAAEKPASA